VSKPSNDDELEAMEASLRRRRRLVQVVFVAVLASPLVFIGYCVQKLVRGDESPSPAGVGIAMSSEQQADLQRWGREVERAGRAIPHGGGAKLSAPAAVLAQLNSVEPSDAPCPVQLHARDPVAQGYAPPGFDVTSVTVAEVVTAIADETPPDSADDAEVIFVVRARHEGFSDGVAFTPGEVRGRAFLWSHSARRIVCAGDVQASSSPSVKVSRTTVDGVQTFTTGAQDRGVLAYDLDLQLERAIAVGLHAVR
jgi:hypothetical protein